MLGRVRAKDGCVWAAAFALLAGVTAACTGDDSGSGSTAPTTSTGATITLTQPSQPLRVKVAQLKGGVKAKDRGRIKHAIAKPIAAWVAGGFLDVEYPQSAFPH